MAAEKVGWNEAVPLGPLQGLAGYEGVPAFVVIKA